MMTAPRLSLRFLDCWHEALAQMACGIAAAWTQRTRRTRISVDCAELSDDRLRDLGLLDGRGPSLRRPERSFHLGD